MKLYKYLLITAGLFLTSCEYDYDIGLYEFIPQPVLNSIINPDSTIKASLYWSQQTSETSKYLMIEAFTAKIYEDNSLIIETKGVDGQLLTRIHPKEGSQYRIEVTVPNYGVISAETSIPHAPQINIKYVGVLGNPLIYYNSYYHFNIDEIIPKSTTSSVMVRSLGLYENSTNSLAYNLYANNSFCDQFNAVNDGYNAAIKGSSIGYEFYIRIPYKNIEQSTPLNFSVSGYESRHEVILIGTDDFGFPIHEYKEYSPTDILIEVIAPSDAYDRYYKSAYQQIQLGNVDPPIFSNIYPIHSNIENGVGIFAGYSSSTFKLELKYDE